MSELGLGDSGESPGVQAQCVDLGLSSFSLGRVGSVVRGGEGVGGAWVDAGSDPGRSYKCVEKSDLKYPLIHGQGRQVSEWPPLKNPS